MASMKVNKTNKIDLIDVSATAYIDMWSNRASLMRLAMLPLFVKACSYMLVLLMGLQDDVLKQGLYFMPSYFMDGWLIAITLRLLIHQEQWPFFLTGEDSSADQKRLDRRRLAIKSCGLLYVLLKLVSYVLLSFFIANTQELSPNIAGEGGVALAADAEQAPFWVALSAFLSALLLLVGSIWAFRYTCLYVPLAIGMRIKSFLKLVFGFRSSFRLIFITIFCFLPVSLVFEILHSGLSSLFGDVDVASGHLAYNVMFSILQSFAEIIINVMTAAALAYYVVRLRTQEENKITRI